MLIDVIIYSNNINYQGWDDNSLECLVCSCHSITMYIIVLDNSDNST